METRLRHLRGRLVATGAPAVTCWLLYPGWFVPGTGTLRQTCKHSSRLLREGLFPWLPQRPCNRAWLLDCSNRAGTTTEISKSTARTAHLLIRSPRRAFPGLANNQRLCGLLRPRPPFSLPPGLLQLPLLTAPRGLPRAAHRWQCPEEGTLLSGFPCEGDHPLCLPGFNDLPSP